MNLLIFSTDIATKKKVDQITPLFSSHATINNWSIDTEDIDNVLRIETKTDLHESDIIHLVHNQGFHCEALQD